MRTFVKEPNQQFLNFDVKPSNVVFVAGQNDLKNMISPSSSNANNVGNVSARKRAPKRTLNDRSSASLNGSGLVDRVHVLRKLGSHPADVDGSLDSFEQLSVDASLNNTKFEEGEDSNGPDVQSVNDISAISDRSEDDIDDL